MYDAGFFTKEQLNTEAYNYNYPRAFNKLFIDEGWQVIREISELQPGDIVFMGYELMPEEGAGLYPEHVQIYAGDNRWYNAGSTLSIQTKLPMEDTNWTNDWWSWWAFRAPELEKEEESEAPQIPKRNNENEMKLEN